MSGYRLCHGCVGTMVGTTAGTTAGAVSLDHACLRSHGGPGDAILPQVRVSVSQCPCREGLFVHRPPRKNTSHMPSPLRTPAGRTGSNMHTQDTNSYFSIHRCRTVSHQLKYSPRTSLASSCAPGCQCALLSSAGVPLLGGSLFPLSENHRQCGRDPSTQQYYCKKTETQKTKPNS